MKKILFIISFFAVASSVMAQSGYYHQIGDTVRGKCPIYHYENGWWPTLNATGHTDSLITVEVGRVSGYMKHTTGVPLRVIGIASTVGRMDLSMNVENLDPTIDTAMDYVLFDATAGGLVEKARVRWTDDYNIHPKRYMELPIMTGLCSNMQDNTSIVPLREYYFDSAITVTDSFYLGCAFVDPIINSSDPNAFNVFAYLASHGWNYCAYGVLEGDMYKDCAANLPEFSYYDSSALDNNWHYTTRKRFQLIFPIIELDTFCVTPGEPQVTDRDGLRVRVEWTDNSNLRWEVSHTAPGGDPDTGLITPTTNPFVEYTDIDDSKSYHVYVRGYCETGIWSGWSDWSTPCLIDSISTSPEDITLIETADFTLSPNPTKGSVQLLGLFDEMTTIEVLDMAGRLLKTFEKTTNFSISELPSDIYIVRVKTRHDNAETTTYLKLMKK